VKSTLTKRLSIAAAGLGLAILFQNCSSTGMQAYKAQEKSTSVSGTPGGNMMIAPLAPSQVNATAASETQVDVTWLDNSDNETGFKIERSQSNAGPWQLAAQTSADVTSYNDTGLIAGSTYFYRVTATNAVGSSYPSAADTVTTMGTPSNTPSPPANLAATVASSSAINLTWSDNSSNESGFKVERAAADGVYAQIGTTTANVVSYADSGLAAQTAYSYRVRAFNSVGDSGYSNVVSATTSVNTATFTYVKANVLNKCTACHNAATATAGYDFSTYASTLKAVVAGKSAQSPLYIQIAAGNMPPGSPLGQGLVNSVKAWIDGGAQNN
jgi:hypothetical protein